MATPHPAAGFAEELRRLRGSMSLRALAEKANCGKSTIEDLEKQRRKPTIPMAEALDTALNGRGKLVEFAMAAQPRGRREEISPPASTSGEILLPGWDDDMLRREFLTTGSAAAVAAITGIGAADGFLDGTSHDLLQAHHDLRAVHGRLDNLRGAQAVYTAARDHHDQVRTWLATAQRSEQQRLNALASDTGGFVGFLTYDLGQPELAITHYKEAAQHAQRAGDVSSCCNLLGQTSRVLADLGHYGKALTLTDQALHLAGTRAHPAVRCWLHAVRAHHHAAQSHFPEVTNDLGSAWSLLARAEDGERPPYIGYLNEAELNKWVGHAAVRLTASTRPDRLDGRKALDEARLAWPTTMVRGSAEMLTASGRIYAAHQELEHANEIIDKAIVIATTTGSARNLRAALDARTTILSRSY
ncbi:helix-turn-helix domain-containing protein [Streptomyces sp. NPDC048508]|uniref:helix-turn-helix domain-containing protein n=1 Tax=Streptomyces sp. NPDC048508 TaxID=3365561 RepID=UPI0037222008